MSASGNAARPPAVHRRTAAAGAVAVFFSILTRTVVAADYQINPRLEVAGGYNDNVTLLSGANGISAADAFADARLDLVVREPNWHLRATPEAQGNWYSGHSDLNSNGEFLHLDGQRTGERYMLGLYGYVASQSLITNYLPTAAISSGLGTSQPGTTLATPASVRQNLGYLRPSYMLEMTPRTSLELDLQYTNASYSKEDQGYTNYRDLAGSIGLALKATPTGSVTLRASAAAFDPDVGRRADTYVVDVQWDGRLSATKQYYLRIGGARTDLSGALAGQPAAPSSTTTVTGGAGAQWTYTLTDIFVDLTHDVEPTGLGYNVNRDQLRLRIARRFTPRFAGFLGMRALRDDPIAGSVTPSVQAQRYGFATAGFEWRFVREFSVIGAYNFTDYHYSGSKAEANAVRISLVYEPHRAENGPAITVGY